MSKQEIIDVAEYGPAHAQLAEREFSARPMGSYGEPTTAEPANLESKSSFRRMTRKDGTLLASEKVRWVGLIPAVTS